jgi:hypothetical protein
MITSAVRGAACRSQQQQQHTRCLVHDQCLRVVQTAKGAMFSTYQVRADRLTALKTSFPEELMLTSKAPAGAPKVISVVAFRCDTQHQQLSTVNGMQTIRLNWTTQHISLIPRASSSYKRHAQCYLLLKLAVTLRCSGPAVYQLAGTTSGQMYATLPALSLM